METKKSLEQAKDHILDNLRQMEELARDTQWHLMAEAYELENHEDCYNRLITIWREARNLQRALGAQVD